MSEALKRGLGKSDKIATARWGDPYDLLDMRSKPHKGIFVGGNTINGHFYPVFLRTEKHALLVADTRSGKGRSSIVPTLISWEGGAYVNDIKGELAGITAASRGMGDTYAQGLHTPVYVFDPLRTATVDERYRVRFNPIDLIDAQDPAAISVARSIAKGIILPDPRSVAHWDDRARNWVKGLCLYAAVAPHLEGKRNLGTVRELAIEGDIHLEAIEAERVAEINAQRDEDGEKRIRPPTGKDILLHTMRSMDDFNGELRRVAKDFGDIPPNERGSIFSNLSRNLDFLDDERVRDSLSESDFAIEDLRRLGATLYVCIPPNELENLKWLSRLMTTLVWDRFGRMGQLKKGENECLFVLDEFATMGRMPDIADQLAASASYGAKMWIIVQNLDQLKELYGSYGRFVGGAGIMQFFEVADGETREFVSRQLGDTEVHREETSKSEGVARGNTTGGGSNWSQGVGDSSSMGLPGVTIEDAAPLFGHQMMLTGTGSSTSSGSGGSESWGSSNTNSESTTTRIAILKNKMLNPDEVGSEFDASTYLSVVFYQNRPYIVERRNYDESPIFDMKWTPLEGHRVPMPWDIQKQQMLDKAQNDNRAWQEENAKLRGEVEQLRRQLGRAEQKIAKGETVKQQEQKRLAAPEQQPVRWYDIHARDRLTLGKAFSPFYWLGLTFQKPKIGLMLMPVWHFLVILAWVLFVAIISTDDLELRDKLLGGASPSASGAVEIWFWQWVWVFERIGNLFSFLTS